MDSSTSPILIGRTLQKKYESAPRGEYVRLLGETFYKISHFDSLPPFFMSLVSSSNHWLFIASTGGLSAGRINADHALFPYYTVDKLIENNENTGVKSILLVMRDGERFLWEPFSEQQRGIYAVERNLYKNIPGSALVFEEINHDLGLTFRYAWRTGDAFGFVKSSWLINDAPTPCWVELLDGLQNLLPAFVTEVSQNTFGSLLDAYKRNELDPKTGLGIFTLNATMTDLAEPSESLLATVAWQVGLQAKDYLLSSRQLDGFRAGLGVQTETETRGERGAYFAHATLDLPAGAQHAWHITADVDKDAASVAHLTQLLENGCIDLNKLLENDLAANTASLERIVASADGLQLTNQPLRTAHHFANVLFNEMRGGYFPNQYQVSRADFIAYAETLDRAVLQTQADFFAGLPDEFTLQELQSRAQATGQPDLIRLAASYLPLAFSRRHGDPSRPWNHFSINLKNKDGSQQLDYEGNWRDIFQNWEALAYAYPEYVESMIAVFLNATTVDGYNPYRITRRGIDWEIPEPGNPWANIGYWSDHQIIYLLKLLEISRKFHPDRLQDALDRPRFSYANVPFHIKPYADILKDPYNTIAFDWELEKQIKTKVKEQGNDAKLVRSADDCIIYSSLTEKLLTLLLAKLVNFVPEGGIWMTTQRPEWNDANNALVGKGLSVVTLAYLRRYVVFVRDLIRHSTSDAQQLHAEVAVFFEQMAKILDETRPALQHGFDDAKRRALMDALGQAGSDYRWNFYKNGFSGKIATLDKRSLSDFLELTLQYIDQTLRANRRDDALYHAYNVLHLQPDAATVSHLYEMLEGQVAILSSGLLSGDESLALLKGMRSSALYRADQRSYILYPDRTIKGFVEKNSLSSQQVKGLALADALDQAGDRSLLVRDETGVYHFAGHIHNIKDVKLSLEALGSQPRYKTLVEKDAPKIEALFEQTFHHDQFTGRSSTFFAYEGLGSIYWHMVSKLLLAVQEAVLKEQDKDVSTGLIERYADIRAGQCFNKSPAEYGAFPTDPYSHTPAGQGAKQPGMSGMVKEEILARQAELGFTVVDGHIVFDFTLLDRNELLQAPSTYRYLDITGQWEQIELPVSSLAYSICQVPVVLQASNHSAIHVHLKDGTALKIDGLILDSENSKHIFERDGIVHHLVVSVPNPQ
ncbi:MAG TPA: hypothetical protein VMC62_06075 [Longilinea sp.]|nr:hypothetical protein [Longilinea sp.]